MKSANNNTRKIAASSVWGHGSFAHICFESRGCRFRQRGYCIMCDYGSGKNITAFQAVQALQQLFNDWPEPIQRVLLGSCGSILDEYEISAETLDAILGFMAHSTVNDIIFETHYTTVTRDVLQKLCSALPGKRLFIEMGLESANKEVLHSLRKYMNLDAIEETLDLIRSFEMQAILNIFLGAPGLSPSEQLEDALQSAEWARLHGVKNIVLFPANIKPGTELWEMYRKGQYDRPSHWLLIEVLRRLPDELLENAAVSWYGDRQACGVDMDIVPPACCEICGPLLQKFYEDFMSRFSSAYRKKCIANLSASTHCCCHSKMSELYGL